MLGEVRRKSVTWTRPLLHERQVLRRYDGDVVGVVREAYRDAGIDAATHAHYDAVMRLAVLQRIVYRLAMNVEDATADDAHGGSLEGDPGLSQKPPYREAIGR